MRLPQITMTQTYAKLGLDIQKPRQEIEQPQADMNMRQEAATLDIRQQQGQLFIDTSEAQANIDLRGPLRRTADHAEFGNRRAFEAVQQISYEGDRLAAIENKGNPIADIAYEESGIYEGTEIIAAGSIIGDGIEIRYEAKKPIIDVQVRGVRMDPEIKAPVHNYTRGKVEGYLLQKNSLRIDAVGTHVDTGM
ncbi:DUF6470 family protein [uncultured Brevibacillus sp.]|uniref:DUF6470 family protein n=1 Tax=uncultured Brevibacillus sp. TaxID=169970 RepID=UPI0025925CEE|nr:DUF6470 family protein [uncultured Brevibacillus sp.]